MKDLTQQMLDDYKPFIRQEKWGNFEKLRREDSDKFGPIVNIKDIYSADGKDLLVRCYQRDDQVGTEAGCRLMAVRVGQKNLNHLVITEIAQIQSIE